MYLIERRPGEEQLYRSKADLAAAIDRGEVDAESRIFHRATSTWISVTLHPLFRAKAAQQPTGSPPAHVRESWTFLPVEAPPEDRASEVAELDPGPPDSDRADAARSQRRSALSPLRALRRLLHS